MLMSLPSQNSSKHAVRGLLACINTNTQGPRVHGWRIIGTYWTLSVRRVTPLKKQSLDYGWCYNHNMETIPEKVDTAVEGGGTVTATKKPKKSNKKSSGNMRQRRAIALIPEHNGSVSAAMRAAGYSEMTAKNPSKLTESKAYKDLIEEFLPDHMLLERHSEIVNAPRIHRTFIKGQIVEETEETDPSQVRALDMAYKLKGKYASDGNTTNVLIVQLSDTSASRYKPAPQNETAEPPS